MVLILVSSVSAHETIVLSVEFVLTCLVREVKLTQVVYENVSGYVLDTCYVSAYVLRCRWVEIFACCVSHYFLSSSPIFSRHCSVMIALNMKPKESPTLDHTIVSLFILIKFLQIGDISSNIT